MVVDGYDAVRLRLGARHDYELFVQRNAGSPGWRQGPFSPWESDVHAVMAAVARGYSTGLLTVD